MLVCLLRIMLFLLAGELTVASLHIMFPASLCGMIYSTGADGSMEPM